GYCLPRARGRWPAGPERAIIHYYCTTFSAKKIAAFARVHRRRTHGAGGRACISCILCRQKMKVFQLFTLFSPFFRALGAIISTSEGSVFLTSLLYDGKIHVC